LKLKPITNSCYLNLDQTDNSSLGEIMDKLREYQQPALDDETLALAQQLFELAREGNTEALTKPLELGLAPNIRDSNGNSLLMLAAYNGHEAMTRLLLQHGADPELANLRHQTPLAGVAFKGYTHIARILIENGADVNSATPDGKTPLMFAAMFNQIDVLEMLLNSGADANLTTEDGLTAIQLAQHMNAQTAVNILKSSSSFSDPDK
jgi:ankyrin repeat protein